MYHKYKLKKKFYAFLLGLVLPGCCGVKKEYKPFRCLAKLFEIHAAGI